MPDARLQALTCFGNGDVKVSNGLTSMLSLKQALAEWKAVVPALPAFVRRPRHYIFGSSHACLSALRHTTRAVCYALSGVHIGGHLDRVVIVHVESDVVTDFWGL